MFLIPLGMIFFLVLIVVVVFEVLDIVDNSREHTGQQAQQPYNLFDFHIVLNFSLDRPKGGTGFFCGRALTIANLKTCVRRYILSPKDSTFASMNQNNDIDMYKGLAVYFLPEGVLNYFDVVAFAEEPPKKNDVLYSSELHIYLDEKDNRTSDMQGSKSKGYTEDKQILDFPVRGRKAVIHIRRKRWLMPDGSCQVVDLHKKVEIEYKGTRYSKEFALFLKMATGQ